MWFKASRWDAGSGTGKGHMWVKTSGWDAWSSYKVGIWTGSRVPGYCLLLSALLSRIGRVSGKWVGSRERLVQGWNLNRIQGTWVALSVHCSPEVAGCVWEVRYHLVETMLVQCYVGATPRRGDPCCWNPMTHESLGNPQHYSAGHRALYDLELLARPPFAAWLQALRTPPPAPHLACSPRSAPLLYAALHLQLRSCPHPDPPILAMTFFFHLCRLLRVTQMAPASTLLGQNCCGHT